MRLISQLLIYALSFNSISQKSSELIPTIEVFQTNLLTLSSAFENRDYTTIHKILIHKEVSEEMFKNEVESAIQDSILPVSAIMSINKFGEFGPLMHVFDDDMAYKRYVEKAKVQVENCFAYYHEIKGLDILVLAEWNGSTFRFFRLKNLKLLSN